MHDLPDDKAVELHTKYSSESNKVNKVYTMEEKRNIKLQLKDAPRLSININQ